MLKNVLWGVFFNIMNAVFHGIVYGIHGIAQALHGIAHALHGIANAFHGIADVFHGVFQRRDLIQHQDFGETNLLWR